MRMVLFSVASTQTFVCPELQDTAALVFLIPFIGFQQLPPLCCRVEMGGFRAGSS